MPKIPVVFLGAFFILLWSSIAFATMQYANQTGKACGFCHTDPAGGGTLTPSGQAFANELQKKGAYAPLSPLQKIVRFICGYLHMLAAVAWFGAILYVHILLKPAYASKGLPKGEMFLGWLSIIILSITGTMLTVSKVTSLDQMLHTRFGVLLTIKIILFLVMVALASLVTFVIGPKLRQKMKSGSPLDQQKEYTLEDLSRYDGKEGRPAYVGYLGNVYDVSQSRMWREGSHARKHLAGFDLTAALKTAPHEENKVLAMPHAGKLLAEGKKAKKPLHVQTFYLFAYINLALVFSILFVIALWRWW